MTESRTREIQLTAKQLVFIFMSTLLVAVVVFLLGVWVGRGIGVEQSAAASQADGGGTTVDLDKNKDKGKSADSASAKDKPGEKYDYPKTLEGSGAGSGASQTPPPAAPPAAPPPATGASTKPGPPPDAAPPAQATPSTAKQPSNAESWYVQVGAFSSKANADGLAASLKAKGYSTVVLPGTSFKVRVGPFPQRAAAEQAMTRLRNEPGVKGPSVTASR